MELYMSSLGFLRPDRWPLRGILRSSLLLDHRREELRLEGTFPVLYHRLRLLDLFFVLLDLMLSVLKPLDLPLIHVGDRNNTVRTFLSGAD